MWNKRNLVCLTGQLLNIISHLIALVQHCLAFIEVWNSCPVVSGCYGAFCGCIQGMPKTEDEWISNQLGDLLLCMKIALNKQSFYKNIAGLDLDSPHHSHYATYIRS